MNADTSGRGWVVRLQSAGLGFRDDWAGASVSGGWLDAGSPERDRAVPERGARARRLAGGGPNEPASVARR